MAEQKVFSLAKAEPFSLQKLEPGISDMYIGLDWDPAKVGEKIDLDAVLIAVGSNGKVLPGKEGECFLFYNNHGRDGALPRGFSITEDNRDGVNGTNGMSDDEAIFIRNNLIDPEIAEMHVFVSYHNPGHKSLADVNRVSLRIMPLNGNTPDPSSVASFDARTVGHHPGAHMATLKRNTVSGWDIVPAGVGVGNLAAIASTYGIPV